MKTRDILRIATATVLILGPVAACVASALIFGAGGALLTLGVLSPLPITTVMRMVKFKNVNGYFFREKPKPENSEQTASGAYECPFCGSRFSFDRRSCPNCGKNLRN